FNDDIQGTASVILGTILAAVSAKGESLTDQVFLSVGAGSAGFGAALLVRQAMVRRGLTPDEARRRVLVTDSRGLLFEGRKDMTPLKTKIQQDSGFASDWLNEDGLVPLDSVIENTRPTIMIGATGRAGTFDETLVRKMAAGCDRPVIMPLSNPTSRAEAVPADLLKWTDGKALVATGSPFGPVETADGTRVIAQCNNVYVFPAMGLGIRAVNARRVTDSMFMAAAEALASCSPATDDPSAPLLPPLPGIRSLARTMAAAVARCAQEEGIADLLGENELMSRIDDAMWEPCYKEYVRP
ncbi:NAD-dependent malic enzyme, partial [bacterium]